MAGLLPFSLGVSLIRMVQLRGMDSLGLYQGLNIVWQFKILWLQVEVDSLYMTQMITKCLDLVNKFSPLIRSI